jgi:trans-aconitate 2-methyltransferase
MDWDPQQYSRFASERSRPFLELLARVDAHSPRRVVDLGCGTGSTTALLRQRWPDAIVEGLDSSPEMISAATELADSSLTFRVADVCTWEMPEDADVVLSNAVLQWIPSHIALMSGWARQLVAGGWLGIQVPGNFSAPTHAIMRELARSPRWRSSLQGVLRHHDTVASPQFYATTLLEAGLDVDVWETTYVHTLPGTDPVLEWLRGTGLRPVLAALDATEGAEFEAQFAAELRAAYPATPYGTLLPYRRIFAVAHRS